MPRLDAIRQIGVVEQTYYHWRRQYSRIGVDQLRELKRLQRNNKQLERALSDPTLNKLIQMEVAKGNFSAPLVAKFASILHVAFSKCLNAKPAGFSDNIAPRKGTAPKGRLDEDRLVADMIKLT